MSPKEGTWMISRLDRTDRLKPLANRLATSARAALLGYFEETLATYGWTNPTCKGTVLTVTNGSGQRIKYKATKL